MGPPQPWQDQAGRCGPRCTKAPPPCPGWGPTGSTKGGGNTQARGPSGPGHRVQTATWQPRGHPFSLRPEPTLTLRGPDLCVYRHRLSPHVVGRMGRSARCGAAALCPGASGQPLLRFRGVGRCSGLRSGSSPSDKRLTHVHTHIHTYVHTPCVRGCWALALRGTGLGGSYCLEKSSPTCHS